MSEEQQHEPSAQAVVALQSKYLAQYAKEAVLIAEWTAAPEQNSQLSGSDPPEGLRILFCNQAAQSLLGRAIALGDLLDTAWPDCTLTLPELIALHPLTAGAHHVFNPRWFPVPARMLEVRVIGLTETRIALHLLDVGELAHVNNKFELLRAQLNQVQIEKDRQHAVLTNTLENFLTAVGARIHQALERLEHAHADPAESERLRGQTINELYRLSVRAIRFGQAHHLDFTPELIDLHEVIGQVLRSYPAEMPRVQLSANGVLHFMAPKEALEALLFNLLHACLAHFPKELALDCELGLSESFIDANPYLIVSARCGKHCVAEAQSALLADVDYQFAQHLAHLMGGELAMELTPDNRLRFELFLNVNAPATKLLWQPLRPLGLRLRDLSTFKSDSQ